MSLLALDTATKTGWAAYCNGRVTSGVWDCSIRTQPTRTLRAEHPGQRFSSFDCSLSSKLSELGDEQVHLVFYEMIVGGPHAGGKASLIEKGLEAMLLRRAFCQADAPCWPLAAGTIKKWALGDGTLTATTKQEMIGAARHAFPRQKFLPHAPTKTQPWEWDDNQCDALWLLDLARALCALPAIADHLEHGYPHPPANLTAIASKLADDKWKPRR
jgi:hypothetical protein